MSRSADRTYAKPQVGRPCRQPRERLKSLRVIRRLPVTWQCGALGGRRLISLEGGNRGPAWAQRCVALELWGFESRGQSAATWAW